MTEVRYCRDCRHSRQYGDSRQSINYAIDLVCVHPKFQLQSPCALAAVNLGGKMCEELRRGDWLAKCGRRGKLWEPKEEQP